MYKLWIQEEIDFLKETYGIISNKEIARKLNRTENAIKLKAQRMGFGQKGSRWKDLTGQRFGRLIARKRLGKTVGNQFIWLCECDCGNYTQVQIGNLTSGQTKSCGCRKSDLTSERGRAKLEGQRFGKLTVVKFKEVNKRQSCLWLCLCDCGQYTTVQTNYLTSGDTKSCGNCQNRVNGVLVSFPQLEIAEILGLNNKEHVNYMVDSKYIDIAIPESKIAIEYDGWYWHQNKQEEDAQRVQELIDNGWRILVIKSRNKIPDKQTILQCLSELSKVNYVELILDDWQKGL